MGLNLAISNMYVFHAPTHILFESLKKNPGANDWTQSIELLSEMEFECSFGCISSFYRLQI